ncbi:MAG: PP2C family protein-serine/threonine phosphatase [Planctomycetota bacterium]
MATLRDYFNDKILRHMQETFSTAIAAPVRICAPDGSLLLGESLYPETTAKPYLTVPVRDDEGVIGQLTLLERPTEGPDDLLAPPAPRPDHGWIADFLKLMAAMLSSLCTRDKTLRLRVDELSTLYRLTAEFTGQQDLQSVLDTVTDTVVKLLRVKACTIRLLSEDRRHLLIKSASNVKDRHLIKGPIPVERSQIDHQVITTSKILYVPDLEKDSRVLFPEGARAEGLASALCVPLVYKGRSLGVIRVYTAQRYEFDRYEHALMFAVAAQAAAAIVNAELQERAIQAANVKRHLRLAGDVQRRMFPHHKPDVPGMDLTALYRPAFELNGDFFDFITLGEDKLAIVVCDVVGKGVRASLLMASIRAAIRAHAAHVEGLAAILDRVNDDLCAVTDTSDFATLFFAEIDHRQHRLTYVNAGHPPTIMIRDDGVTDLSPTGGVLGVSPEMSWQEEHVDLRTGDIMLAYTDGVTEALNFQDEAFGRPRLEEAIQEAVARDMDIRGISQHVLWRLRNFIGLQARIDDLTIVGMTVQ